MLLQREALSSSELSSGAGPTVVSPSKAPQQSKKPQNGPTITDHVLSLAAATKERRGISLAALKKALTAKGYDVNRNNARVNLTVRQLVQKGSLVKTSGHGAAGSFKLNRLAAPKQGKKEATRKKVAWRTPTPSKRTRNRKRSPRRQTKPRKTTARPLKRRPKTGARPRARAKARSRLKRKVGRARTARVYRRYKSAKGKRANRGRTRQPVGRQRQLGPRRY
ncbi:histone H1-like [Hypanus sabinus]|uniref:histone H1-like n=1 Tax=Hypanus sabinus TaxID=79690 RepID=UPI0028C4C23A|nr:histone H1-like [Hypanus sabinus]